MLVVVAWRFFWCLGLVGWWYPPPSKEKLAEWVSNDLHSHNNQRQDRKASRQTSERFGLGKCKLERASGQTSSKDFFQAISRQFVHMHKHFIDLINMSIHWEQAKGKAQLIESVDGMEGVDTRKKYLRGYYRTESFQTSLWHLIVSQMWTVICSIDSLLIRKVRRSLGVSSGWELGGSILDTVNMKSPWNSPKLTSRWNGKERMTS